MRINVRKADFSTICLLFLVAAAVIAQANLTMASLSPCGLPWNSHSHLLVGGATSADLETHLAHEFECLTQPPRLQKSASHADYQGLVLNDLRYEASFKVPYSVAQGALWLQAEMIALFYPDSHFLSIIAAGLVFQSAMLPPVTPPPKPV